MSKPNLFDNKDKYTDPAMTIETELANAIAPIMSKYSEEFSVRQIFNLAVSAAYGVMLEVLLSKE